MSTIDSLYRESTSQEEWESANPYPSSYDEQMDWRKKKYELFPDEEDTSTSSAPISETPGSTFPRTIYRGLELDPKNLGWVQDAIRNGETDFGDRLLDEIESGPYSKSADELEGLESVPGLGRHWSRDIEIAKDGDYKYLPGREGGGSRYPTDWLGVVFEGEWDGNNQDLDRTGVGLEEFYSETGDSFGEDYDGEDFVDDDLWGEEEDTLLPGATVNLKKLHIRHPETGEYFNVLSQPSTRRAQKMKRQALIPIQRQGRPAMHRVAGWDWDYYQNGYITTSAREFECDCGNVLPAPAYSNCKCGKIWNSYVIGSGGEGREASIEKMVCREIPVRENVIVAKRRQSDATDDYLEWAKNLDEDELERGPQRALPSKSLSDWAERARKRMGLFDKLYKEARDNIKDHNALYYNSTMRSTYYPEHFEMKGEKMSNLDKLYKEALQRKKSSDYDMDDYLAEEDRADRLHEKLYDQYVNYFGTEDGVDDYLEHGMSEGLEGRAVLSPDKWLNNNSGMKSVGTF